MKIITTFFFLFSILSGYSMVDTSHFIKVHFLYGSKPLKKFKAIEKKVFGGIHGGQVTIQVDSFSFGFEPILPAHVFSRKRKIRSDFVRKELKKKTCNDSISKTVTFVIHITVPQHKKLLWILDEYDKNTPYDYAFFGMRCANAVQDVLGQIGILNRKSNIANILSTFYPKKLRKRLFVLAKKRGHKIIKTPGSTTRKWERD